MKKTESAMQLQLAYMDEGFWRYNYPDKLALMRVHGRGLKIHIDEGPYYYRADSSDSDS